MPEVIDGRVVLMIEKAIRAGAFRVAARRYPDAAETLMRAADVNSAKVRALAEKLCSGRVEGPARAQP
jgi:hypothetical protein